MSHLKAPLGLERLVAVSLMGCLLVTCSLAVAGTPVRFVEAAKWVPPDASQFADFGRSMAVSGDSILVGAPGVFHEVGEAQGAVDMFALGDDGFTRLGRLDPPDPAADYERYGAVLAAEGDLAAVTSTSFFGTSDSTPGWVRILRRRTDGWVNDRMLSVPLVVRIGAFGAELAVSSGAVAASAVGAWVGSNRLQGAVMVYDDPLRSSAGIELTAEDGAAGDYLGASLAFDGDLLFVGASGADTDGVVDAGAVYVFQRLAGGWTQIAKLLEPELRSYSYFGSRIAEDDGHLLVGAGYAGGWTRTVHVYSSEGESWRPEGELPIPDLASSVGAMVVKGDRAAVTSTVRDEDGASVTWEILVFQRTGTGWELAARARPEQDDPGGGPSGVALVGNDLVVSVVKDGGALYLFRQVEVTEAGVPTLSSAGVAAIVLLLAAAGFMLLRKR